MARIRSVKPEICESETMAMLSAEVERTFVRLWTHCDDHGRTKDHPKLIAAALFPLHDDMTADRVDEHLDELANVGLIVRYRVRGRRFLAVSSWHEHQKPQKARPSALPAPEDADPVAEPEPSRTPTVDVPELYGPVVEWSGSGVDARSRTGPAAPLALIPTPGPSATAEDLFADFWAKYPRKVAKADAQRAHRKATNGRGRADPVLILERLARQIRVWAETAVPDDKIPHAATWLNGRRWEDDHLAKPAPDDDDDFAGERYTSPIA